MGSYIATLIVSVLVVSPALVLAQQPQGPTPPPMRSITRITGDLYRVQNNDHYTVFLVTPAGIILADPINVDAAAWIKAQLDRTISERAGALRPLQPSPSGPCVGRRRVQ